MRVRTVQFIDTDEWRAGSKSKDVFVESLDDYAAQIASALSRPTRGVEFEGPPGGPNDPRTGTLVEDTPAPPTRRDTLVADMENAGTNTAKIAALEALVKELL